MKNALMAAFVLFLVLPQSVWAQGKPVKTTWTREEDITHSPFRPLAKARYRAVLGNDGIPKAVLGSVASPSIRVSLSSVPARMSSAATR